MKIFRHIFVVLLLLFISTTATAQSQSDNTQTKAVSATKADVNGDGVVNEADIEEILAIMQQENGVKYYWYVGNGAELTDPNHPMNNGIATNINADALTFTLNTSNSLLQTATSYTDLIGKEFPFPNHFIIPTEWLDKIRIVNANNLSWAWGTTVTDPTNNYTWCWNGGTATGTFKIVAK
jgi:uncharacterized membrane protein